MQFMLHYHLIILDNSAITGDHHYNGFAMKTEMKTSPGSSYYPIFVSLTGKVCLVVGGGTVAERKIRGLLRHAADVRLIAQELSIWLQAQCEQGRLQFVDEKYQEEHLEHVDLVFAATSDLDLNRAIADHAGKRGIWCNMATEPELGSFFVPAIMRQGPLSVAVSTSGLSPALASKIRDKISLEFGPEWALLLKMLGLLRDAIQSKDLSTFENQSIFREIAELPLAQWIAAKQKSQILETIHEICRPWLSRQELERVLGQIW